jgi:uncharacterized damage-inducible protein DinB
MRIADMLVQELDLETPFTRRALERVPEDKFKWKPAEKSMELGWLATFSALLYSWGVDTIEKDTYDFVKELGANPKPVPVATRAELLALFDKQVAAARAAILRSSDEHLAKPWTLAAGGKVIFSQPRWLVIRTFVFNHAVHHRGQLTVYLRLLGIPVPAIYNDSADEKGGLFVEQLSLR